MAKYDSFKEPIFQFWILELDILASLNWNIYGTKVKEPQISAEFKSTYREVKNIAPS